MSRPLKYHEAVEMLRSFVVWFQTEEEETAHSCGNWDGGNPKECDRCKWRRAAYDMERIIQALTAPAPDNPSQDWEPESLRVVQLAYRKHVLEDPDIGWAELEDKLADALANAMGPGNFTAWLESQNKEATE